MIHGLFKAKVICYITPKILGGGDVFPFCPLSSDGPVLYYTASANLKGLPEGMIATFMSRK